MASTISAPTTRKMRFSISRRASVAALLATNDLLPILPTAQAEIAEDIGDVLSARAWLDIASGYEGLYLVQAEGHRLPPLLIVQGGKLGFGKRSNPLASFGPAYLVARKVSGRASSAVLTIVLVLRRHVSQNFNS